MNAPPSDVAAERAVLGAALMGSRQLEDATEVLAGRDFYHPRHEVLWDACLAVLRSGRPVDAVAVIGQLGADLERVGGGLYVAELTGADVSPNPGQLLSYAGQVADAALRRRLQEAGIKVQQYALQADTGTEAATLAQRELEEAAETARTTDGGSSVGDSLESTMDWLETPVQGADTPWADLNDATNGWLPGTMVVVAGRPGHGKSLVAKDAGVFTARQGLPVHIATLEMSRHEYMARILAGLASVNIGAMLQRKMADADWSKVAHAAELVRDLPLYLDDRERQSMAQIRAAARATSRRFGKPLGMVAIDYAQLVTPEDRRIPREQQVAQISRDTKTLAKELQCPVLLLAQLNRGNVSRSDQRPMVSDLRESGALEQDADQVLLLHRPDQYATERLGEVDVIVGKNRNGPAGRAVPLTFQGHLARIASLA